MRAFWSGTLEWGMLVIPVKLYSSSKDVGAQFHRLHKPPCGARLQVVNRCPTCNVDVPWDDIVSGTEVAPGKYAVFAKEERGVLKDEQEGKAIRILHTSSMIGLTPNLFDTTYWVGAGGVGVKAYSLFRDVLSETQSVAIGYVTLKTKSRLAMLGAQANLLTLTTLHYHEEIVDPKELVPPALPVIDKEKKLARELVLAQREPFDPSAHVDEYQKRVAEAVAEKMDGGEVVDGGEGLGNVKPAGGDVLNLADQLSRMMKDLAKKSKRAR